MRMVVVFWVVGIKVGPTQLKSTNGFTFGKFGSGVEANNFFASLVIRAGSIIFGIPLYINGWRCQVTESVVKGSYSLIILPWVSTNPRKSPLRMASVGML